MNGGKSPECRLHAKEGEGKLALQPLPWAAEESPSSSSSSGVQLAEAPILVLTYFHEAFRQEIGELHRCVMKLAAAGSGGRECLWELRERFELLKLAYGYHRAAEDEVLLVALDSHVKYVACTYSLEHRSLDELFDSTIQFFDLLMEDDEKGAKPFQELLFSIGTVHSFTCKHMLKEEKQVFPLLRQQFSRQEQALLVWQFLGSIPIKLLEDFYSRMASFIPAKEQEDIIDCVKCMVIPKESPLHEVITDWLRKNGRENVGQQKETSATIANFTLIEGFRIWHAAISRDLVATLDDLYLMESSGSFSNLSSVIFQLKFLLDVLIFYRNALDHIYYPQIDGLADGCEAPLFNWSCNESQIRNLQQFLNYDTHDALLKCNFIEPLLHRLKSFIEEISIFFTHQEIEVFDKISENCSPEMQRQLLYMSIHILPLGWLERVVLWFSDHFSAPNHKQGNYLADDCSTLPPLEQFYTGCSHKTSMDMIGCDPQDFFKSRFFSLSEQFGGDAECSPSTSQSDTRNNTMSTLNKPHCGRTALTAFLSLRQQASHKFSKLAAEKNDLISDMNSWDPFQIIFCFHKALKKDLENLLCISVRVTDNTAFFEDFQKRIVLIRSLYQAHSDMEDEVAFPALEEKGKVHNICHSYTVDHRLEAEHFDSIFVILEKISELSLSSLNSDLSMIQRHHQLCLKLQDKCRSFQRILTDHVQNEEVEVWSSLKECLSIEEQEKIIGGMLGRIRAEVLQDMIPWLMDSLTLEEQHMFMSSWRQIARNTMFGEWLSEWWEGNDVENAVELDISPLETEDPLEVISTYLAKDILKEHKEIICDRGIRLPRDNPIILDSEQSTAGVVDKGKNSSGFKSNLEDFDRTKLMKDDKQAGKNLLGSQKSKDQKHVVSTSQEELEAAIRRLSRDSSLDPHKKSCIIQNLLMSRWIVAHQQSNSDVTVQSNEEQIWGCSPSYRDLVKMIYGCKHYKRNCKLLTPCCNQLYPCRHCHDEETDHSVDRKLITKMMCMKCLIIQPIGPTCLTESCNNLVMARYYCRICKIYDDERDIYHCPYCNLCRVGKGLGIDYFHCMTCNACMSRSLSVHVCRQKCLEDNCPICHEFMFTSSSPTKALPCGHLMHSACFKDYTCTHYTCPICSKSLGDMQGYFQTLDTMLAEDEVPDEYSDKAQAILCNDCEKRGSSPFHWRYHKCPHCGSYNTRLL